MEHESGEVNNQLPSAPINTLFKSTISDANERPTTNSNAAAKSCLSELAWCHNLALNLKTRIQTFLDFVDANLILIEAFEQRNKF